MENISYIGLSHQTALKKQLNVTANNIANMSTPGFKSQSLLFNEYLVDADKGQKEGQLSMVVDHGTFRKTEQGPLQTTGNPLDVSLQGEGYFAIEVNEGENYTRSGSFSMNADGEIVTQAGRIVQSAGGGSIIIPPNNTNINIDQKGIVSTLQSPNLGQLKVVRFEKEQELIKQGDGLYDAGNQEPLDAENTRVLQGMIEGSNVQPIVEMNRMIEVLRSYQKVQNMLQKDHERQRSAISKLTRTN